VAKFSKGHEKKGGREKGSVNHLTKQMKTVKETVLKVFNELQQDPETDLIHFAKEYPRDFHQIAAKLIPTEIKGEVEVAIKKMPSWINEEDKQES